MWEMGAIPMPGGWLLSAAWLPMCGQSWPGAAVAFVGMWTSMMVAMMLPSLAPLLHRLRPAPAASAAAGYFCVWTALGLAVFAVGAAFAQAALQAAVLARAAPLGLALVVVLGGALQFTAWKARHLAWCRPASAASPVPPACVRSAWRYGLRLGLHCCRACAGLTAILLALGVMQVGAMAVVAAAITAERLAPAGQRVAWAVGAVSIAAGVYLMGRAAGLL